jgi:glycosyltransferase involved in cell wall biosynthesis
MDTLMKKGKWNIIVRTQGKNNEMELKNALYSIVAQDYENKSIILIIHSDDEEIIKETTTFIKHFEGLIEIKTIIAKEKQGVRAYPLNLGLENIDGEYLSFLDHDDIYYPNMGSFLIWKLNRYDRTFACGGSIETTQRMETDFDGNDYLYTVEKKKREEVKFNKFYLLLDNFIPFNTFVMRTSLIGNTTFDERLDYLEDWDFLKKIALKETFSVYQTDRPVSEYRRRYDETDTYNEKTQRKWQKARKITDENIKKESIELQVNDILYLRQMYLEKIREYINYIRNMEKNTGYRIWEGLKKNKLIANTFVKWVRELRHRIRD